MDRESILQKFESLNTYSKDGERSPHKPLLVIHAIGELLRGKGRLLPFSEIDENLGELLGEYGIWRSRHNTHYPFWRLRCDGIWEVTDACKIPQNKSKDVPKSYLLKHNIRGGFTEDVAKQLLADSRLASEIIWKLLDRHFTGNLRRFILQDTGIELSFEAVASKKRDPRFRKNILQAYKYRCAVCGFDVKLREVSVALEAAHIKWHQEGGPDVEENGLALCSLHHDLFDRGTFTLSNDMSILVSKEVCGDTGLDEWLMRFHGHKLNLPQKKTYYPNESYIHWHVKEVFKGEYREL